MRGSLSDKPLRYHGGPLHERLAISDTRMRTVILHGHIFKNAGTTLDWSLERMLGRDFLDHRQDSLILDGGMQHVEQLLTDNRHLRAISSHHMPAMVSPLPGVNLMPVYLLRHPLGRIVSVYEFERQQDAETPGARAASSKSFPDYVRWRMTAGVAPVVRDYQTLYLSGGHGLAGEREVGAEHFLCAIETLRGPALVGVVERYDESMVYFEEAMREHFPAIDLSYVAQNVSRRSSPADRSSSSMTVTALRQMDEELQATVIDHNGYDLSLYRMASEYLDVRVGRIPDFGDKLADFRGRCQRLPG